jgi:hypothetical protein
MDAWAARALLSALTPPLVADELAGLYHIAAESRHGSSPGLCSISTTDGAVLTEQEAVQQEIFSFYEAIFQGRHGAAAGADAPADSGVSFVPDEAVFNRFLPGLTCLSKAQRESLEAPSPTASWWPWSKMRPAAALQAWMASHMSSTSLPFTWWAYPCWRPSKPCWRPGSWEPLSIEVSSGSSPRWRGPDRSPAAAHHPPLY